MKKLKLNRETVRQLTGRELDKIKGAYITMDGGGGYTEQCGQPTSPIASIQGGCTFVCASVVVWNCEPDTGVSCAANSNCGCTYD